MATGAGVFIPSAQSSETVALVAPHEVLDEASESESEFVPETEPWMGPATERAESIFREASFAHFVAGYDLQFGQDMYGRVRRPLPSFIDQRLILGSALRRKDLPTPPGNPVDALACTGAPTETSVAPSGLFEFPVALLSEDIFYSVVSLSAWATLSAEEQAALASLLPASAQGTEAAILSDRRLLNELRRALASGRFHPDVRPAFELMKVAKRAMHAQQTRNSYDYAIHQAQKWTQGLEQQHKKLKSIH